MKKIGMKRLLELTARAFHFRGYAIDLETGSVCDWADKIRAIMVDNDGVVYLRDKSGRVTQISR